MTTPIVDSHCHVGLHKYEPVEALLDHMRRAGVANAVLIQYMGNADNGYILECFAAHPGRFAAAMIVEKEDDGTRIRNWAERGIVGIRLAANARADGADPLAQWRTAAALGLVVSAPSRPATLRSEEFLQVLREFPDLPIVIEHLGGIGTGSDATEENFRQVMTLARHPNLTIKLPGFGEFCAPPHPFAHIPPWVDMTLEAFGPRRIMWGSDYPPVSSREGYGNSLRTPQDYLSALSEDERSWIFGRTALTVWKLAAAA
jgi:L-fuconolactonase